MRRLLLIVFSLFIFNLPAHAFSLGDLNIGGSDELLGKRLKQAEQLFKVAAALAPISDKEEIMLGKRVAARVIARYGIEDNQEATYYLNLMLTAIAQRSDRPEIPYRVAILATDDVNAYAAPGGYIFVTRGVLNMVQDEAELAAVLAHEVSHISERHIVNALRNSKFMNVSAEVAAEAFRVPGQLLEQMTNFATDALFKGLKKTDEYDSDQKAIEYLDRLGYDYPAMFDLLELLDQRRKQGATKVLSKTHPSPQNRIRKLRSNTEKLSLEEPTGIRLPNRFVQHINIHKKSAS